MVRPASAYASSGTTAWPDNYSENKVGTQTKAYVGDNCEWVKDGPCTSYYTFNGRRVAMRDGAWGLTWLHGDQLGSASLTTNANGGKVSSLSYTPFGHVRDQAN